MSTEHDRRWYALTVTHQHERPVERALRTKGFEALAPFYRSERRWSDRVKQLEMPLFAGYVFCRAGAGDSAEILSTPGARKIVGFGRPTPIPDQEIAGIQALLRSVLPLSPWPYLKRGDQVCIEQGPFKGLRGTVLREAGALRVVVGIDLLQRSIAVELHPEMIVPARIAAGASVGSIPNGQHAGQNRRISA